jgi:hypothetical protein
MSTDWLPGSRALRLAMAKNWLFVLGGYESPPWGIPPEEITGLGGLAAAADAALSHAMSSDRTHTLTVACRLAFEALDGKMRFFKSHYFLVPPLTPIDLARLGLAEQNPANPIPRPDAQPIADLAFPGIHLVELRNIRPVAGPSTDPRSDCRVIVRYGLTGTPTDSHRIRVSGAPLSGKDLPETLSTRRKKELFDFDGESGNTVYFCLQYENPAGGEGGQGPFGPVFSAVIP